MKTIILSIILQLVIIFQISGQVWFPETANWKYNYGNLGFHGYTEMEFELDTLINGQACKKFNTKQVVFDQTALKITEFSLSPIIMFEEGDIVFLFSQNEFDTLFNFNGNVGDFWTITNESFIEDLEIKVEITDTGSININNQNLRWYSANYHYTWGYDSLSYIYPDTIIEKIGNTQQYILPWDGFHAAYDGHEGGKLRCYSDILCGLYNNNYPFECDSIYIINGTTSPEEGKVKIFPNPVANNYFVIKGEEEINEIEVIDLQGITIRTFVKNSKYRLDGLQNGIYFLKVKYKDKLIIKKLIKQ